MAGDSQLALASAWLLLFAVRCFFPSSAHPVNFLFVHYAAWAAFINSVNSGGVPDLLLTAITFAFFFMGFILGLFEFGRLGGIALLGITGGLALGIRIMLMKGDLLLDAGSLFAIDWIIIAFLGAAGGLSMIWWQRAGIVSFATLSVRDRHSL